MKRINRGVRAAMAGVVASAAVAATVVAAHATGDTAPAAAPASPAATPASGPGSATFGIHDSAINGCDGFNHKTSKPTVTHPDKQQLGEAASSFNDSNWAPLKVHDARAIVPWDIAEPGHLSKEPALQGERQCFDAWLAAAKTAKVSPEVDFQGDPVPVRPHHQAAVPNVADYVKAIEAFRKDYVDCGAHGDHCGGHAR
ncbi:MAG: hypothetical protein J2P17_24650, partial [Mycobacterium sp.]|nr:hypothetical protein [Mycobacterium sp.]